MTAQLPKLIATSVVRGSQKGQSHGGVYLVDFGAQQVDQVIDWNSGEIDFTGRGWDRGLRGIEFTEDAVWIAASDELFCYSPDFQLLGSYRNQYLKHCHEISRKDHLLFLTSTGHDSLLVFNLNTREFIWGLYISKNGQDWVGQRFDPDARGGPPFANNYHINMVSVSDAGIFFSGLNTGALLRVNAEMQVALVCSLPTGCHNAQPFQGGVLFNDTASNVVRCVDRSGKSVAQKVMLYPEQELDYAGVDSSKVARQGFARGLCVIEDKTVAVGTSPSTITLYDLQAGSRLTGVNLTMDIRNAIHGLEVWPF
ncbi:MAG: hypothetical protein ACKVKN_14265 [Pseudomonadales bacterium]|jgi:hypothetical protein|tara:strand:- start:177 stop:1109 length:933 start_codon:yes stop_codon:yes gene_type:complete